MDEPTNHLDLDAAGALIEAIKAYKGGVIVVTHDQHLINSACNEIWYIKNKKLKKFNGNFRNYRKSFLEGSL